MADDLEQQITVEDDVDSAYDPGDSASETTSLRSAVTDYVYENGRRYNSYRSGSYWGPNDSQSSTTLDITHHVYNLTFQGQLYLAPIPSEVQRVLDLGTGTGLWPIEFADLHPTAIVTGTDLSPIQPLAVPPNCSFEIDDFEASEWTFKQDEFDFIHARGIFGCVANYDTFYANVLRHLKPGGWYEQAETTVEPKSQDGSIEGTVLEGWGELSLKAGDEFGKTLRIVHEMGDRMKKAGFVNVKYEKRICPMGGWPKDEALKRIGLYNRLAWEEGMEGWMMYLLTRFMGWQPEEVQVLCAKARQALRDRNVHAFQDVAICYGQKPPISSEGD